MKSKRYIFYFYHHNISTQTETSLLMVGSKTRSVILFFFPNCLALTFDLKEQWNVYDDKSSCSNAAPWLHFLFSQFMMLFLLLAGKRFSVKYFGSTFICGVFVTDKEKENTFFFLVCHFNEVRKVLRFTNDISYHGYKQCVIILADLDDGNFNLTLKDPLVFVCVLIKLPSKLPLILTPPKK